MSPKLGRVTRDQAAQLVRDTRHIASYSPAWLIQITKELESGDRCLCSRDRCLLETSVGGVRRHPAVPRDLPVWDEGCAKVGTRFEWDPLPRPS